MDILAFYQAHPLWSWLTLAAVLLGIEILTGTGWLLWPTVAAALTGLIALPLHGRIGLPGEIVIFAALTVASTFLGRRYLPKRELQDGPDINDRAGELVGQIGKVTDAFIDGHGRVLVDGAEWVAEAEGDQPRTGDRVKVVKVLGGAKLTVKAI